MEIFYIVGILFLLYIFFNYNKNEEYFTNSEDKKKMETAFNKVKKGLSKTFDELQKQTLVKYFDAIVNVAKSQLEQPEKGDIGETGEKGDTGQAGGTYVRSGTLTLSKNRKFRDTNDSNKNGVLSIQHNDTLPTTETIMQANMEPFNMSPSQDWMLLPTGQLMNNYKKKCLIGSEIGGNVIAKFDKCAVESKDTTIHAEEQWTYNLNGQMVSRSHKFKGGDTMCLAKKDDSNFLIVEPCDTCNMDGTEDNSEFSAKCKNQQWWWN